MKWCTSLGHRHINRQNAAGKGRQDMVIHPGPEDSALFPVASLD